ncbi:MAG: MarR family winged helix-turn-helix transcriptional regulator [Myxococcota bacterium]
MGFEQDLAAAKRAAVGHTLLKAARLFNELSIRELQRTHPQVRQVHTLVLPHLDLGGTRLTTLAERAGVTKQFMGQIVDEMEALGVLERRPDPSDRRAKLVCFTEAGRRSMFTGLATLAKVEAELRAEVGDARMEQLREGLDALLAALERRDRQAR